LIVVAALVAGGAYLYYDRVYRPRQVVPEPIITTDQVRRGDLVISVSGSGTLVSGSESALGFQAGSYVDEVSVEVGDTVEEGDLLATAETDDLERAVFEADIKLRLAQLDLAAAQEGPSETELADATASVRSAQTSLTVAQLNYDSTLNSDLDAAARTRQIEFQWCVDHYYQLEQSGADQSQLQEAWNDWSAAEYQFNQAAHDAEMEQVKAWNQVERAQRRVEQAQENLEELQSGPITETITQAELKVSQATLALENARDDLEAAQLRAPFDGTILEVNALPGQHVGTTPFITLADLAQPRLLFWVEEADMAGVVVGNRVEIIFEALPDDVFSGEVVEVASALVAVDRVLAVEAWANIDLSSQATRLLDGMNAEVEIISDESRDTLLVPVQALRALGSDQYAVFVVQPDGEMLLRTVEVGLMDPVSAEILSGLELGEVVSTGVQQSTGSAVQEELTPPGEQFLPPGRDRMPFEGPGMGFPGG
jgi:RND family efflux transporter MFP subunit